MGVDTHDDQSPTYRQADPDMTEVNHNSQTDNVRGNTSSQGVKDANHNTQIDSEKGNTLSQMGGVGRTSRWREKRGNGNLSYQRETSSTSSTMEMKTSVSRDQPSDNVHIGVVEVEVTGPNTTLSHPPGQTTQDVPRLCQAEETPSVHYLPSTWTPDERVVPSARPSVTSSTQTEPGWSYQPQQEEISPPNSPSNTNRHRGHVASQEDSNAIVSLQVSIASAEHELLKLKQMMLNCENTKDETEKLIYRCLASLEAETLDSYERMQSEETLNNVTLTLDLLNEGQRDATHRKELLERELEEWKVELEKLKAAASHPDTDAGRQVGNENTHPSTQCQENVEVEKHSANRKQDTCQSADTKDVSTLDTFVCDQEKVAANALTEMSSGSGYECGEFGDNLPVQYEVMMVDQAAILESIRLSQESTQARSCDENNAGHNVEAQQQVHVKYIDTASRHKDQKPVFHSGTKYTRDERQASSRQVIQRPPPNDHAYINQSPTVPDTTWDRPIRHYELVSQTNADQHPVYKPVYYTKKPVHTTTQRMLAMDLTVPRHNNTSNLTDFNSEKRSPSGETDREKDVSLEDDDVSASTPSHPRQGLKRQASRDSGTNPDTCLPSKRQAAECSTDVSFYCHEVGSPEPMGDDTDAVSSHYKRTISWKTNGSRETSEPRTANSGEHDDGDNRHVNDKDKVTSDSQSEQESKGVHQAEFKVPLSPAPLPIKSRKEKRHDLQTNSAIITPPGEAGKRHQKDLSHESILKLLLQDDRACELYRNHERASNKQRSLGVVEDDQRRTHGPASSPGESGGVRRQCVREHEAGQQTCIDSGLHVHVADHQQDRPNKTRSLCGNGEKVTNGHNHVRQDNDTDSKGENGNGGHSETHVRQDKDTDSKGENGNGGHSETHVRQDNDTDSKGENGNVGHSETHVRQDNDTGSKGENGNGGLTPPRDDENDGRMLGDSSSKRAVPSASTVRNGTTSEKGLNGQTTHPQDSEWNSESTHPVTVIAPQEGKTSPCEKKSSRGDSESAETSREPSCRDSSAARRASNDDGNSKDQVELTCHQWSYLTVCFHDNKFPSYEQIAAIAHDCDLDVDVVVHWYVERLAAHKTLEAQKYILSIIAKAKQAEIRL